METPDTEAASRDPEAGRPAVGRGEARLVPAALVKAFRWTASYEFSCLLLFLLFVLTLLGTLFQVNHGVYAAQEKYFESVMLVQRFGALPLPLPGGRLILTLLFFNLLFGAILRARKDWSRVGILTAHAGILMLLAGAFITYRYAQAGQLVLREGEQSSHFESRDEWELAVTPLGAAEKARQNIVALSDLQSVSPASSLLVTMDTLPFDLELHGYVENAVPQSGGAAPAGVTVVDGYFLRPEESPADPSLNRPGVYVTVRDRRGGSEQTGIVWAGQKAPWTARSEQGVWSFELQRRRWPLPFTLVLDRFSRELHPRTSMAKAYASEVTKIEGGKRQAMRISMNEPLRSHGYTLYQASWGPQDASPDTPLYSVLAVTRDPAERFPLYACIVITCGMALHFALRLLGHLRHSGAPKP